MRPLTGLTWAGTLYLASVLALGALLVPLAIVFFPTHSDTLLLELAYLALFTQLAALMPIKWRHGKMTLDSMPLIAASLVAPGVGPVLLSWLCRYDGRWPSKDVPLARLLFNRARSAIEFGVPSIIVTMVPLPPPLDVPIKTLCLAAGCVVIGYPLTAKTIAVYERESFWRVLSANVGFSSIRSVLILGVGGGALYMVLQQPAGYVMGLGLLGLLLAVRSNMADNQRQHIERIQTLELMAQALDARDPLTELHSQRVANLAMQIAQALGMSGLDVERIRVAGLLHDIGKIGVPDAVLKKPSGLSPDEWLAMRRHAEVGADMIAGHTALQPIAPWVRYHHERWNGSGYPAGLSGTNIPLGARILAVADSFDTVTGPRVYRRSSMSPLQAVDDISSSVGVLYDPVVVNALRRVYGVPEILTEPAERPRDQEQSLGPIELLRSAPQLRWLGAGMTASSLGDPLTAVAVTVTAYGITRNAVAVGVALMLRAAATMLAGALLGGAVDRWPRRPVIITADIAQLITLLATPALLWWSPWTLLGIVAMLGAATAIGQAGREASVAAVLSPSQIATGNGVIASGTTVARAAGYPLAAAVIWVAASSQTLFVIDGVTFAVAAAFTVFAGSLGGGIRTRSVTGAVRATLERRELWAPLLVAGIGAFAIFMTQPAVIVLAFELTRMGTKAYTALEVILTLGMLVGALLFARSRLRPWNGAVVGLALMGAFSLGISASSAFLLSAGFLLLASIGNQIYFIGNRSQLQRMARSDRVGSVMATRGVLVQTMAILGSGAGGVLASAIGGRLTFGIAGAILVALAVAAAVAARPTARRLADAYDTRVLLESRSSAPTSIEMAESA